MEQGLGLTEGGVGIALDPVLASVVPLWQVQHAGLGGNLQEITALVQF